VLAAGRDPRPIGHCLMTPLREALDRTLLLIRDEIREEAADDLLLETLVGVEVALVGDESNLSSHSAQCAFVTAATLMARSGHKIYLVAPDLPLSAAQPPLTSDRLITSLAEVGHDLLPGIEMVIGAPDHIVDLAVSFGDAPVELSAQQYLVLSADMWSATLSSSAGERWPNLQWPIGGMAAGCLAASEAFKVVMQKLRAYARSESYFAELFKKAADVTIELAPGSAQGASDFGRFDFVSAGAITNAALYCLGRIPGVRGEARVIEHGSSALSNLNRYALLRRSQIPGPKAADLATLDFGLLRIEPICLRYEAATMAKIGELAPSTLVGVDDIPTRWEVQKAKPKWLSVGATTHWSAMASFHRAGLPCAQCLHPLDDPGNAPIPTVAFVSFWAGLLLATYFVRHAANEPLSPTIQQTYFSPLRPESPWRSPVALRLECPLREFVPH
jgi:hypothetical protein